MLMNRFRRLTGANSYASELGEAPWEQIPAGGNWLDIGCGTGVAVREAARLRPDIQILAIDVEPTFDDGQVPPPNLRFLQADAESLALGERFDVITGVHVLHFLADKQACLTTWQGLLKSGGRMLANWDPTDVWLGRTWVNARPLSGTQGVMKNAAHWGQFVESRWSTSGNRQGVTSRHSLYAP